MRRLTLLVFISVFVFSSMGVSQAAELQDGFMGVPWGSDIADLPDFVKVDQKHDVTYYGNPQKSYTLFDIDIPYVTYAFYSAKFFAVYVDIASIDVYGRLKDHLTRKYGTPRTTLKFNEGQRIYNWKHQDIKIKLKLYQNEGKMKLGFYYEPLSRKVNKALREEFPPPRKPIFPMDERRLGEAMEVFGF